MEETKNKYQLKIMDCFISSLNCMSISCSTSQISHNVLPHKKIPNIDFLVVITSIRLVINLTYSMAVHVSTHIYNAWLITTFNSFNVYIM